jgi:two-component system cell cycle sensor histidine kinase/response regulator CckA
VSDTDEKGHSPDPGFEARILGLVLRQMPAVYWFADRDLRIVSTGGAIESVLGYKPDRWIGSTLYDVQANDGGTEQSIVEHQRALKGETITYQSEYRGKHLRITIGPERSGGEIIGVIGTAIDITAVHALERRMIDAQRAESLGVLAGGLAHDFNNLLVAIIGNADLGLRDTHAGSPGRSSLENIRSAGLRAAELTDQLLSYAGRGGVATTRVSPRGLVDELLRIAGPTIPANVSISVDIPEDLALRGEPSQIRQVILNLIGNARDALHLRGGTLRIEGRLIAHAGEPEADDVITPAAGRYLELSFSDDGPGIDRETRRKIFEPFFTTKSTGHGLGLAAVLGIVRSHGGGLRLISEPGTGARFEVLLPATTTAEPQSTVLPLDAPTVLIIDDEDLVRDVVARMLEDLGYRALTAPDGPTGLAIVDAQLINAVLVDLTMPRMSGADVVAALREIRPAMPVIVCSGYDRDRRGAPVAEAWLPKPFRIDALEQTLAKLLRP